MFDDMMFEDTTERESQKRAGQAALDWHRLYDWARVQPEGAVLGRSCTNSYDPLCRYLGQVTGTRISVWSVGPSIQTGYNDRLQKPDWVRQLILETDRETGNVSGEVTREMYLQVLERVKPAPVED